MVCESELASRSSWFMSLTHFPFVKSVVLSVARLLFLVPGRPIESFMNIIKRKWPSIEPCGTPLVTGNGSDRTQLSLCPRLIAFVGV